MSFLLTSEMFTLTIFDGNISEHTAFFFALVKYIEHSFASPRCQSFCLLYFNTVIFSGATYFYLQMYQSSHSVPPEHCAVSVGTLFRLCLSAGERFWIYCAAPHPISSALRLATLFSFIPCGCGKLFCCVRRAASWHLLRFLMSAFCHSSMVFSYYFSFIFSLSLHPQVFQQSLIFFFF